MNLHKGTVPPGFDTPAEAWGRTDSDRIVALMRRPGYDGTQSCNGDDAFTDSTVFSNPHMAELMHRVCAGCPFLTACRDYAYAHDDWNYMGGTGPSERRRYRKLHGITFVDRYFADDYGLIPAPAKPADSGEVAA